MTSDASGQWGCGAWYLSQWFQWQWTAETRDLPIAVKELIPIILGCAVWGHAWAGHRITWHCDNQAVVACLRSRTSKHPILMHLIRNMVFIEAYGRFYVQPEYIDTHSNHLADDLSRNSLSSFLSKVPTASRVPTPVPAPLADLLLDTTAEWLSPQWGHRFRDTLNRVWPAPPGGHIRPHQSGSMSSVLGSASQPHSQSLNRSSAALQHS